MSDHGAEMSEDGVEAQDLRIRSAVGESVERAAGIRIFSRLVQIVRWRARAA